MVLIIKKIKGLIWVLRDYIKIKKHLKSNNKFKITKFLPIVGDKFNESGVAKGAYFHQDLFVARKVYEDKPIKHVDIGSRIDGFVAHVAVFREIEVFDIRKLKNNVKNVVFRQSDLMKLDEKFINYCDSISCLHTIEHFGLGRYGDPLDVDGHLKGLNNIYKILKKGGKFYFSVPIGSQRIEFNAHRIFDIKYLIELFDNKYQIISFSFVDDFGDFHENINLSKEAILTNCSCNHGCGIFELKKI